ncbi:PP1-complex regulatory subunit GLC8 NDAI_0I02600 [Naumovozyma dairenensis CBS 421]|uniref:Protein GLC8 n=1 Tax=Naumovozyma dairenensis (strain ATCC 10597 / BCRC 20456 / CBS 421 / NBRC 0211 / NRRL Y-12639) TaxID=1071378 RepID=G0WGB7_NAUDC|nr:hypothetical protein NDAI_0I02600 [Naumovozyma dairenensis CBS 421]CCD26828.1 hypothetical protein NDAI_0I02600 [Naumovozyma dairenensis CBS 421]
MGGILKNPLPKEQLNKDDPSITEFRKQVLKNTQLNARLAKDSQAYKQQQQKAEAVLLQQQQHISQFTPKDTISLKHEQDERLQWNQKNLNENEITKQQFQDIHIDEPKTPYQGAVDPAGEYYRVDEDDLADDKAFNGNGITNINPGDDDDFNDFSLGEPEFKIDQTGGQFDGDDRIEEEHVSMKQDDDGNQNDENVNDDDDEAAEKEAKHRRFEEMRKKHYNLKEVFKSGKLHEHDNAFNDNDDDDDDGEELDDQE